MIGGREQLRDRDDLIVVVGFLQQPQPRVGEEFGGVSVDANRVTRSHRRRDQRAPSAADQRSSFLAKLTDAFAGLVDGNKRCSIAATRGGRTGRTFRR